MKKILVISFTALAFNVYLLFTESYDITNWITLIILIVSCGAGVYLYKEEYYGSSK